MDTSSTPSHGIHKSTGDRASLKLNGAQECGRTSWSFLDVVSLSLRLEQPQLYQVLSKRSSWLVSTSSSVDGLPAPAAARDSANGPAAATGIALQQSYINCYFHAFQQPTSRCIVPTSCLLLLPAVPS
jgi:hypothetical protein